MLPVQPAWHWQLSGATQVPWVEWHPWEQIAITKYRQIKLQVKNKHIWKVLKLHRLSILTNVTKTHHIVRDAKQYAIEATRQVKKYQLVYNKGVVDPTTF